MGDTFVTQKEEHKQDFLEHIKSVDLVIKCTVEDNREDGAIPFLDTIVKAEPNGRLCITVYRKPTYTDQYLQWDSHHLSAKYSVINTLTHRAKQFAVNVSFSKKKWIISGSYSLQIPKMGHRQGGKKAH